MASHPVIRRRSGCRVLPWLLALCLVASTLPPFRVDPVQAQAAVTGPVVEPPVVPGELEGDLRRLPQVEAAAADPDLLSVEPERQVGGKAPEANWVDPVAQTSQGPGQMPLPLRSFPGLSYGQFGSYAYPPDPNGAVGPGYYLQIVNFALAVFDKKDETRLAAVSLNDFFQFSYPTPCESSNRGDPIVLYDGLVGRWLVADFAWANASSGPFYECLAVSKTADPLAGGWWFYSLQADDPPGGPYAGYLNDYPKFGIWTDGWYMTANMYEEPQPAPGYFVRVWALPRDQMIAGKSWSAVHFDCQVEQCDSLLPASLDNSLPPASSPAYFLAAGAPNRLSVWKLSADWAHPENSRFQGPVDIRVAPFAAADPVPQPGGLPLDSLSFRLMMPLQYQNRNGVESLWAVHTVAHGEQAGPRWYEIRDPGGLPSVAQQSTFLPDALSRWMPSLALDIDGNLAMGYSVASTALAPGIRYTGRLEGELPNRLTQAEASLVEGGGSQYYSDRWGDYSSMNLDPEDGCTFWYTNEYYSRTSYTWETRIGAFRFPSCQRPLGAIRGTVRDAVTRAPVAGAPVIAASPAFTRTVSTRADGTFRLALLPGDYSLTAGALLPGYPISMTVTGITVTPGLTQTQNILLSPAPFLIHTGLRVQDDPPGGNGNQAPEPGEANLQLWIEIQNHGALTATQVTGRLESSTPGVSLQVDQARYADIPPGEAHANRTPFVFSISNTLPCGVLLNFTLFLSGEHTAASLPVSLTAAQNLPRVPALVDNFETGSPGWSTGGINNRWALTPREARSPTHAWTDSPPDAIYGGDYSNFTDSELRSPRLDLSQKTGIQVSGWTRYTLENGADFVTLEYSLDDGLTWSTRDESLAAFNGFQNAWQAFQIDAPQLNGQPQVSLRFHMVTDGEVAFDGFYLDDFSVSYQPAACAPVDSTPPGAPRLIAPAEGQSLSSPVTFSWQPGPGAYPTGYALSLDGAAVLTFTTPVTSTRLNLGPGVHIWSVAAFRNGSPRVSSPARRLVIPWLGFYPWLPVLSLPPETSLP